jgi:hypothetical protein
VSRIREIPFTSAMLRELFFYDPETGSLLHRERPITARGTRPWNKKYAGREAGTSGHYGYRMVGLPEVGVFYVHRVIWKIVYGTEPSCEIDHINGVRGDNRLANLREATRQENTQNTKMYVRNTSGFRGVVQTKWGWRAKIRFKRKTIGLGTFSSPEEASAAYMAARQKLFSFNPIPRERSL